MGLFGGCLADGLIVFACFFWASELESRGRERARRDREIERYTIIYTYIYNIYIYI